MALQQDITKSQDGFTGQLSCADAYYKIDGIRGSKDNISFDLVATKNDVIVWKGQYSFTPSVADDADNFIKQAYVYLKTLSEFANAEDV